MDVSLMLPEARLDHVLRDWRDYGFETKPVLVKTFTAGLNHCSYLVETEHEKHVVKIFSEPQPNAFKAQAWAAKRGLAPNISFRDSTNTLMIMEFVPDSTVEPGAIKHEHLIQSGSALKNLHGSDSESLQNTLGKFDLMQSCENYLQELSDEMHSTHSRLNPVLNAFINDPTPWTLCHNDLVNENCFIGPNQIRFIDWEYAQSNNPWFDLAAVVLYSDLSREQASLLIDAYHQGWGKTVTSPIFYASQCAVLWLDMLWHMKKFGEKHSISIEAKSKKLDVLEGLYWAANE